MIYFTEPTGTNYVLDVNQNFTFDLIPKNWSKFRYISKNLTPDFKLDIPWLAQKYLTTFLSFDIDADFTADFADNSANALAHQIIKVEAKDTINLTIFENFMLASFGFDDQTKLMKTDKITKIKEFFVNYQSIQNWQLNLNLFLVKNQGLWVGAFALIDLIDEIQLHAVAGKATDLELITNPKLPILVWAAKQQARLLKKTTKTKLTFSSSQPKLIQRYTDLGAFEIFDRECWILQKS